MIKIANCKEKCKNESVSMSGEAGRFLEDFGEYCRDAIHCVRMGCLDVTCRASTDGTFRYDLYHEEIHAIAVFFLPNLFIVKKLSVYLHKFKVEF